MMKIVNMRLSDHKRLKEKYVTYGRGRSQRLKNLDHSTPGCPFYVTACTRNNERFLNKIDLSECIIRTVDDAILLYSLKPYILCIMPTHYHFLFELTMDSGVSLFRVLKLVNGRTGLYGYKTIGKKIWQKGYYEHVLRKDENIVEVAKYIATNPQRWDEHGKHRTGDHSEVRWYIDV
jgi:REP element-mobilizing transposase RayT